MVRVGVEASVDDRLLKNFTKAVELVRLAPDLDRPVDVDFWVAPLKKSAFAAQLAPLRGVKVIQGLWAGVDGILPLVPAEVTFCDGRGVHDIPTAEWTVAVILAMQKYLPLYMELQREENWEGRSQGEQLYLEMHGLTKTIPSPWLVDEVANATVLIVGYGAIGQAVEARLTPFGCKFLRVARTAREGVEATDRLDALLPEADAVVLILPLTPETQHLMDAKRIGKMKHGALLVNAGRGPVVDTEAMLQALKTRKIRAAVDVTDPEPLPPGHPLWKAPNFLLTPHVAGSTARFVERAFKFASEQADRYARGEPLKNVVANGY